MKKSLLFLFFGFDVLLILAYVGASAYFADLLVAGAVQPVTAELVAEGQGRLDPFGIPAPENVAIPATAEIDLASYFYDNPANGNCGMVILHGYTGSGHNMTGFIPMFWARGCEIITYDARGHGNSSAALHTFGYYEREDASAVVDWLSERTGVPASNIGLLGVSYGAATSLQTLALRDDLAFVIADSAYQDYETIVSYQGVAQYGEWINLLVWGAINVAELRADFEMDEVSPMNIVSGKQTPVLLIHAKEDSFTFASHSEAIFANANPDRAELHITDWGNDHGASRVTDPEAYEAIVAEFIATHVGEFGQPAGR
ncbi:MAG: alpha/beta fold hydrolase [Chloroflexi bacterium]|nr:alpha/beta fold hydrolase [Chloroflexota bacterium]